MKVPRVFTAVLLAAAFARPCAAADEPSPTLATLSKTSQALLSGAAHEARVQPSQQPSTTATDSRQFFRSKKGTAVVAILAAGFAYTLYSRFHDEIKSPIREQ